MMSSEEDLDLSDGKGKSSAASKQQTKRVRQRVDAGEPRNSYASIPNFSSRPPGYVGATTNGFASKMLCDLIGSGLRPGKDDGALLLDAGDRTVVNGSSRMFMNGGELLFGRDSPERCSSAESSSSHLLRDILLQQGRSSGHGPKSPPRDDEDSTCESKEGNHRMSAAVVGQTTVEHRSSNSPGCSSRSSDSNSPPVESLWQDAAQPHHPQQQQQSSSVVDVKRARVETIVNNMLQGPQRARPQPGALLLQAADTAGAAAARRAAAAVHGDGRGQCGGRCPDPPHS